MNSVPLARGLFEPTSNGHEIFVAHSHRAPLSAIMQGLSNRNPFITIIGEAGVGKTTLVNAALLKTTNTRVRIIRVCNRHGGALSLPEFMAQIIGKDTADSLTEADGDRVFDTLTMGRYDKRRVVLIVDDAHSLAADALTYLRLVSDLADSHAIPLQMIFVGRPIFREMLRQEDVLGRITVNGVVEPLSGAEAQAYIRRALSLAGFSAEQVLSDAALLALAAYSDGIPSRINAFLESARVIASERRCNEVTEDIVAEAAAWLNFASIRNAKPLKTVLAQAHPVPRRAQRLGLNVLRPVPLTMAGAAFVGASIFVVGILAYRRLSMPLAPATMVAVSTDAASTEALLADGSNPPVGTVPATPAAQSPATPSRPAGETRQSPRLAELAESDSVPAPIQLGSASAPTPATKPTVVVPPGSPAAVAAVVPVGADRSHQAVTEALLANGSNPVGTVPATPAVQSPATPSRPAGATRQSPRLAALAESDAGPAPIQLGSASAPAPATKPTESPSPMRTDGAKRPPAAVAAGAPVGADRSHQAVAEAFLANASNPPVGTVPATPAAQSPATPSRPAGETRQFPRLVELAESDSVPATIQLGSASAPAPATKPTVVVPPGSPAAVTAGAPAGADRSHQAVTEALLATGRTPPVGTVPATPAAQSPATPSRPAGETRQSPRLAELAESGPATIQLGSASAPAPATKPTESPSLMRTDGAKKPPAAVAAGAGAPAGVDRSRQAVTEAFLANAGNPPVGTAAQSPATPSRPAGETRQSLRLAELAESDSGRATIQLGSASAPMPATKPTRSPSQAVTEALLATGRTPPVGTVPATPAAQSPATPSRPAGETRQSPRLAEMAESDAGPATIQLGSASTPPPATKPTVVVPPGSPAAVAANVPTTPPPLVMHPESEVPAFKAPESQRSAVDRHPPPPTIDRPTGSSPAPSIASAATPGLSQPSRSKVPANEVAGSEAKHTVAPSATASARPPVAPPALALVKPQGDAPSPPPASAVANVSGREHIGNFIRSGDAMLVVGNVLAARQSYERAAAANSGAAATRMGKTYDPTFLVGIGAESVRADPAAAAAWYRRAIALGDAEARGRLNRLDAPLGDHDFPGPLAARSDRGG